MSNPKIAGVVVSRDDWGLLAVSVTHALLNHVDEVFILDHGSTDQTVHGLRHLQRLWPERIRTLRSNSDRFEQESATNVVAQLALQRSPDWIYVFDSDEFLITAQGTSLREILRDLKPDQVALRYPVNNFISTVDFDEHRLDHYQQVRVRAKPSRHYDEAQAYTALYEGSATFFDFPFVSKLMFRARALSRLTAGAHQLMHFGGHGVEHQDTRVHCAHLTLPSRQKLERKAEQGSAYIRMGMPANFGWQAQLIHRLKSESKLDWFWARHSVPNGSVDASLTVPYETDTSLVESLALTLKLLEQSFKGNDLRRIGDIPLGCDEAPTTDVSLDETIDLCAALQRQTDVLIQHIRQRKS